MMIVHCLDNLSGVMPAKAGIQYTVTRLLER